MPTTWNHACPQGIRKPHVEFQYDPSLGINGTRALHGYSTVNGSVEDESDDCHGHGTHVAAIIGGLRYGVAKNVTLHAGSQRHCLLLTYVTTDYIPMHLLAVTATPCR